MRILNFLILNFLLTLSVFAYSSEHIASLKRLSLMSYVSFTEGQYEYDLNRESLTTSTLTFFPNAYAYKEGETCLILGFQSTLKNGICRLSLAKGAKKYRNSCVRGQYACNPEVFGTNGSNPFCISASLGPELSKYCSHQAVKSLSNSSSSKNFSDETKKILKKVANTSPKNFEFEHILEATKDNNFNKSFNQLFQEPNTIINAKNFTSNLCGAIHSSKNSKSYQLDLQSCQNQLKILSSTEIKEVELKEIKKVIALHSKPSLKMEIPQESNEHLLVQPQRACPVEVVETVIEKNINNFSKIQNNLDASLYMKCINELFYNKDLPVEARGKYFHKLGDQTHFAKQCWELDQHGEDEIIYSFVSEEGFKIIKYPVYKYKVNNGEVETSLPRNLLKFYDGNKPYYISQFDNIGEYFDSLPEKDLSKFLIEHDIENKNSARLEKKYITSYEDFLIKDKKDKKIQLISPEEAGLSTEDAKSCIKDRLKDYVNIIMFRSHGKIFPYASEINEDIKVPDRSTLRDKYIKTTEEIRASLKEKIIPKDSACNTVINDEEYNESFKKAYGNRIDNYNKYRKYFID